MGRFDSSDVWVIGLDFDGTIRKNSQFIENDNVDEWELTDGFRNFYDAMRRDGHKMVLFTARDLSDPAQVEQVSSFLIKNGLVEIYFPLRKELPTAKGYRQQFVCFQPNCSLSEVWCDFCGDKMYCDIYIDDLAIGFPKYPNGLPDWDCITRLVKTEIENHYAEKGVN